MGCKETTRVARNRLRVIGYPLVLSILGLCGPSSKALAHENLFFLHHSTGHNLIDQGADAPGNLLTTTHPRDSPRVLGP